MQLDFKPLFTAICVEGPEHWTDTLLAVQFSDVAGRIYIPILGGRMDVNNSPCREMQGDAINQLCSSAICVCHF